MFHASTSIALFHSRFLPMHSSITKAQLKLTPIIAACGIATPVDAGVFKSRVVVDDGSSTSRSSVRSHGGK